MVLTGPRQSGKTTLLKHLFGKTYGYVSLELPDIRAAAAGDPRGFLETYPPPVIFDEVQYAPELLPYIKERIDAIPEESARAIADRAYRDAREMLVYFRAPGTGTKVIERLAEGL